MLLTDLNQFLAFILIGFTFTAITSPLVIWVLYKFHIGVNYKLMNDGTNAEFMKIHGHKSGTPTLGGIMMAIVVGLAALVVFKNPYLPFFLLFWWLGTIYGLVEGLTVYTKKLSDKFRLLQESFGWRLGKLLALFFIGLLFVILAPSQLGLVSLNIFGLFAVPLTWLTTPIIAIIVIFAVYGIEISDGADGLASGLFLITLFMYALIALVSGNENLLPYIGLIVGSLLVYLYFNIHPARIFMGGTGTFPIGFAFIMFAFVTNTFDILILSGLVYWAIVGSSTLQILWLKLFKRKLFRIAPLNHYFEAIGWPETKMVQRFWLASGVFAIFALWIYTLTR